MAINFPDSPSNGDKAHGFTYNSTKGTWESSPATGGGVTVYANLAAFPSSGNTVGDYAFATNTKALYVWDGAEWDRISTGNNETPRLTTTPASVHQLNSNGSTSSITIAATDPEGFPITYSYDTNPANPNQITNVVENNGVFTLTPSTTEAHEGNFTMRLKASDGISTISHPINVSLTFDTVYTFDTSESVINTNYTADNKVECTVIYNGNTATAQQSGKLGKGYFEMKLISATSNYAMLGVQVGDNNNPYGGTTGIFVYQGSGRAYGDGLSNDATYGAGSGYSVNDIINVAYDTNAGTNGQVWFGKNGNFPRNPATQTGHNLLTDASSVGLQPAVGSGSTPADTFRVEIISHSQGPQYTLPTGWSLA